MALDKDILGQNLYNVFDAFNNKDYQELGDIEAARLLFCKQLAREVIAHFRDAGVVTVNPLGLTAAATPVTGTATGTIS